MAIVSDIDLEGRTDNDELRGPAQSPRHDKLRAVHEHESVGADAAGSRADWQRQAMCLGKTAIFFAPPGERDGRRRRREALASAYCACCPVQRQCLTAGRDGNEHGIWGGESDEERAAAGFAPKSPHRRAVAQAARAARERNASERSAREQSACDDVA